MIVCDIKLFEDISDIQISGDPDTVYAEVCEIIKAALQTVDAYDKYKIKNDLSNAMTWEFINLAAKYKRRCQIQQ